MIDERSGRRNITHPYMTLDQYYYASLADTTQRDRDQVLGRFISRAQGSGNQHGASSNRTADKSCGFPSILIVNQLWLCILDESEYQWSGITLAMRNPSEADLENPETIITSSTQENADKKDAFVQCVLDNLRNMGRNVKASTKSTAELILSTAIGHFGRRDIQVHQEQEQEQKRSLLEVYSQSISAVVSLCWIEKRMH